MTMQEFYNEAIRVCNLKDCTLADIIERAEHTHGKIMCDDCMIEFYEKEDAKKCIESQSKSL